MLEQIKQVGMTYLTQRYLWWGLALFSLIALPNLLLALSRIARSRMPPIRCCSCSACRCSSLLPFLVGQVKMQFAHSRARLMPHFLPAHLVGAVRHLADAVRAVSVSVGSTCRSRTAGLARVGLGDRRAGLVGRTTQSLRADARFDRWCFTACSPIGACIGGLSTPPDIEDRMRSSSVVGAVLVIAWLWRLCHLHEEMDDYQNVYQCDAGPAHRLRSGRAAPHRGHAGWPQPADELGSAIGGTTGLAATTAAARPAWCASCATASARIRLKCRACSWRSMIICDRHVLQPSSAFLRSWRQLRRTVFLRSICRAAARPNGGRDDGPTPAADRLRNAASRCRARN